MKKKHFFGYLGKKKKKIFSCFLIFLIFIASSSIYGVEENEENIVDTLEKKSTDEFVEQILQSTLKVKTVALKKDLAVSKNFINLADLFDGQSFSGIMIGLSLKEGSNYFSKKDILYLMQENELTTEKLRIDGKGIAIQYYPASKSSSQNYAEVWCLCYGKDPVYKNYVLLQKDSEEDKRILSKDLGEYIGKSISVVQKNGPILIRRNAKLLSIKEGTSLSLAYQGKEKDDPLTINWNAIDF